MLTKYINRSRKLFPFFLDFNEFSAMDYSLQQMKAQVFHFLVDLLIKLQEGYDSAHLVDSWIKEAVMQQLDINCVFDSQLCSTTMNQTKYSGPRFPDLSPDPSTKIVAYPKSFLQLLDDQTAYNTLFQDDFPMKSLDNKGDSQKESYQAQAQHNINYVIDYQVTNDPRRVFDLIRHLAKTSNMAYFRSKFIQRMIDH